MEQKYTINNIKSFDPKHIFECGQCFRWEKEKNDSYTIVFEKNVINIKKENEKIIFNGICDGDIQKIIYKYFDLGTNYENIKKELSKIDDFLKTSIEYGNGIRILKQDLWETIISFIISANNNIPRIKKIIENLSKKYGEKIIYKNKTYYTFPTPKELAKANVEDLRKLGLGFRDKRIYSITKMIVNKEIDLKEIENLKFTKRIKEKLLILPGIGPKVSDCIMLFALKKFEVFPIDVWVKRVMNEIYIKKEEKDISTIKIEKLAKEKFGNLARISTTIFILLEKK